MLASDPALRPPADATGTAARLAALAARDAAAARGLAFAAAALQLLALALAAALQPDGDDDAAPADMDDDEGAAHAEEADARGGVDRLRAPLLQPRPSGGSGGALSADEWSERMCVPYWFLLRLLFGSRAVLTLDAVLLLLGRLRRTRYNLDTSALTYDPRRRGPPPPPPRRVQGPSAEYDSCSLQ